MKSVEEFRDQLVQCIQNKKNKVDILQVIKDCLYGCFKNDELVVLFDLDDWEANNGAFLSITDSNDENDTLFIPKEKKNDFILYLKNMNDRLEYLKHKIQKSINNPTTKTLSITNLFYSN